MMSNVLQRFIALLPSDPEFIGTVTHANHPNYKVLLVDGTGVVLCTAVAQFNEGQRVFVQGTEIKRQAPTGNVIQITI